MTTRPFPFLMKKKFLLQFSFSFNFSFTSNINIAHLKWLQQEEIKSHTQIPHPATSWVFTEDTQTPSERRTHKLSIQDCDTFKTWNWTDLDKKAKLLYSLWFQFLCPGVLILQNAACRAVQTVLRADVSLGQCPAGHPSARDSIPSQVQHWRITHWWASAFEKQGL